MFDKKEYDREYYLKNRERLCERQREWGSDIGNYVRSGYELAGLEIRKPSRSAITKL